MTDLSPWGIAHFNLVSDGQFYKCPLCEGKFGFDYFIAHHISYDPEELVFVCRKCHSKIHKDQKVSERKIFLEKKEQRRKLNLKNVSKDKQAWSIWIKSGGRSFKKFKAAYAKHPDWSD